MKFHKSIHKIAATEATDNLIGEYKGVEEPFEGSPTCFTLFRFPH